MDAVGIGYPVAAHVRTGYTPGFATYSAMTTAVTAPNTGTAANTAATSTTPTASTRLRAKRKTRHDSNGSDNQTEFRFQHGNSFPRTSNRHRVNGYRCIGESLLVNLRKL